METDMEKFDDFIAVYDDVASAEFCKNVIDHYGALKETRRAFSRQESEGVNPLDKTGGVAFLTDCPDLYNLDVSSTIVAEFHNLLSGCFNRYSQSYGILGTSKLSMNHNVQIQETPRTGGYHIWHHEQGAGIAAKRCIFVQMYLNTVQEGGETEFLYQSKRVESVQGRVLMCPSGFTHTHRGNPPLKGTKFTMNSWIEFVDV